MVLVHEDVHGRQALTELLQGQRRRQETRELHERVLALQREMGVFFSSHVFSFFFLV